MHDFSIAGCAELSMLMHVCISREAIDTWDSAWIVFGQICGNCLSIPLDETFDWHKSVVIENRVAHITTKWRSKPRNVTVRSQ